MATGNLGSLQADLAVAVDAYKSAEQRLAIARNEATTALNRLNDVQKALDVAVAELQKTAPRESDWARSSCRKSA